MAERNEDLAYQTLDYIREHPEEWDQRLYYCGTTACYAGRAIILDADNRGLTEQEKYENLAYRPDMTAAELLGWTKIEAEYVFGCMTRDFAVLEGRVKDVLNNSLPPMCRHNPF